MSSLSKIQTTFKALVATLPPNHWFGVTHLGDDHPDSFATAIGSDRDTILKCLQHEDIGRVYKGAWTMNESKLNTLLHLTLELSAETYQTTTGRLPGSNTTFIYIAKGPKKPFAKQQKDGMPVPTRPLTDSSRSDQWAGDLKFLTESFSIAKTAQYVPKGRRPLVGAPKPHEVPPDCKIIYHQFVPATGKVRYILECERPPPPGGVSSLGANPKPLDVIRTIDAFKPEIVVNDMMDSGKIEVADRKDQPFSLTRIPRCSSKKSAQATMRKNPFINDIAELFGNKCTDSPPDETNGLLDDDYEYCHGAEWMAESISVNFPVEFHVACERSGHKRVQNLSPVETGHWMRTLPLTENGAKRFKTLAMAKWGISILASKKEVDKLSPPIPVNRTSGVLKHKDKKGKEKESRWWTRNPYPLVQYELSRRALSGEMIGGFKFPLVSVPCVAVGHFGDHGNIAYRAAINMMSDEASKPARILPAAYLLAKDTYSNLRDSGIASLMYDGLSDLQEAAVVVVSIVDLVDGVAQRQYPILVPRRAIVNASARPVRQAAAGVIMPPYNDSGIAGKSNLIVDRETEVIESSAKIIVAETTPSILGISWERRLIGPLSSDCQEEDRPTVVQSATFETPVACRDGYSNASISSFPVVVLNSGDKAFIATLYGREDMSNVRCNHCNTVTSTLLNFDAERWTLDTMIANGIKAANATSKSRKDAEAPGSTQKPKVRAIDGQKDIPLSPVPPHLNVFSTLHNQLGPGLDTLNRMEDWIEKRLEILPIEERELRAKLRELTEKIEEIRDRAYADYAKELKDEVATIERMPEDDIDLEQLESLKFELAIVSSEAETDREELDKALATKKATKEKLNDMNTDRSSRLDSANSVMNKILGNNGIDRQVYHNKSLIGPHIRKMCEDRVEIREELIPVLSEYRSKRLSKLDECESASDVASVEEIKEETRFFANILGRLDVIFSIVRKPNGILSEKDKSDLKSVIDALLTEWISKRDHEEKEKSCSLKFHDIFAHLMEQIEYLGRLYPWLEDWIERFHKDDKNNDYLFSGRRGFEEKENVKEKRMQLNSNPSIEEYGEFVVESRKRKFSPAVQARRDKAQEEKRKQKKARRSYIIPGPHASSSSSSSSSSS